MIDNKQCLKITNIEEGKEKISFKKNENNLVRQIQLCINEFDESKKVDLSFHNYLNRKFTVMVQMKSQGQSFSQLQSKFRQYEHKTQTKLQIVQTDLQQQGQVYDKNVKQIVKNLCETIPKSQINSIVKKKIVFPNYEFLCCSILFYLNWRICQIEDENNLYRKKSELYASEKEINKILIAVINSDFLLFTGIDSHTKLVRGSVFTQSEKEVLEKRFAEALTLTFPKLNLQQDTLRLQFVPVLYFPGTVESQNIQGRYVLRIVSEVLNKKRLYFFQQKRTGREKRFMLYVFQSSNKDLQRIDGKIIYTKLHKHYQNSKNRKRNKHYRSKCEKPLKGNPKYDIGEEIIVEKYNKKFKENKKLIEYKGLSDDENENHKMLQDKDGPMVEEGDQIVQIKDEIPKFRYERNSIFLANTNKYDKIVQNINKYLLAQKQKYVLCRPYKSKFQKSGRSIWFCSHEMKFDDFDKIRVKFDKYDNMNLFSVQKNLQFTTTKKKEVALSKFIKYFKLDYPQQPLVKEIRFIHKKNEEQEHTYLRFDSQEKAVYGFLYLQNQGVRTFFYKDSKVQGNLIQRTQF